MNAISNITRPQGDPKIIQTGPGSLGAADRLGRALGWFSIGLGAIELLAPSRVTRALGMEGNEGLVRAYGIREIGGGILSLSLDKEIGLWARIAGDGLDLLTVATALRPGNSKRGNAERAFALVAGITVLDVIASRAVANRHQRKGSDPSLYRERSGFPGGVESARGAAVRDVKTSPPPQPAAQAAPQAAPQTSPRSSGKRGQVRPDKSSFAAGAIRPVDRPSQTANS